MVERFAVQAVRVFSWYSAHRNHVAFYLVRVIATLGILAASVWFIWRQLVTGYTTVSAAELNLDAPRLTLSWLCTAAATALGAWEWTLLLNALGGHIEIPKGMRIHLVANLMKYVPGFVWPYVGKSYLATRHGVTASIAVLSVVAEFAIVFFTGILLLALALPFSGIVPLSAGQSVVFQLGAILLAVMSIAGIPFAGRWLFVKLRQANLSQAPFEQVNWKQVVQVVIAILLTWCLLGLGFSILATPASSHFLQAMPRQTFALASALLIGQVAFLVPMGIGVREAVFLALLGPDHPASLAVVIAIVFRLLMTVGEFCLALTALFLDKKNVITRE
jgi:hypothetical protein